MTTNQCIILDLDETLVHTIEGKLEVRNLIISDPQFLDIRQRTYVTETDVSGRRGEGNVQYFWGVKRPDLNVFLKFCFSHFRIVAVWSAGIKSYVNDIVDEIFRDVSHPHIVYTRDDCEFNGAIYIKPIEKMIQDPRTQGLMSFHNTHIVDDRTDGMVKNLQNGVHIPEYDPETRKKKYAAETQALILRRNDGLFRILIAWFSQIKESSDVRAESRPVFSLAA